MAYRAGPTITVERIIADETPLLDELMELEGLECDCTACTDIQADD